jgi:hypothetical protein
VSVEVKLNSLERERERERERTSISHLLELNIRIHRSIVYNISREPIYKFSLPGYIEVLPTYVVMISHAHSMLTPIDNRANLSPRRPPLRTSTSPFGLKTLEPHDSPSDDPKSPIK